MALSHADRSEQRGGSSAALCVGGWAGGACVPKPADTDSSVRFGWDSSKLLRTNLRQEQSKANGLHLSVRPVGRVHLGPPQCRFY